MLRGKDDTFLFAGIDAGSGTAEIAAAALANLCEDQGIAIFQNQVDLAETAAVVGFNQFEAVPLQI
jgi:hypothetical protein